VISGLHSEADEDCTLLGCDAASSINYAATFRDNLHVPKRP